MTKWTKFDSEAASEAAFEAFHRGNRYQRDHTKLDKSTQARLDSLADRNERLSRTNLALTNMLKRAMHFVPAHIKGEYERLKEALDNGSFDEVHL